MSEFWARQSKRHSDSLLRSERRCHRAELEGTKDWGGLMSSSAAAAAKSGQSCPTLCDPIDSSPPGSSVHGILQARIREWVAISSSNAWKWKVKVKLLSRVRLLATPWTACSLPGSSNHGICQARVLEWGAIAFSHVFLCHPQTPLLHLVSIFQILVDILTVFFFVLVGLYFFIPLLLFLKRNKHVCTIHHIKSEVWLKAAQLQIRKEKLAKA